MIAIINYFMGNLQSVANVLEYLREPCLITNDRSAIAAADKIILPGVGAFGEAMSNLKKLDLIDFLKSEILENKKPFLGICLGMQILGDIGYEGGENAGLGIIPGEIKRLTPNDPQLPVPHMGWNDTVTVKPSKLFGEVGKKQVFYFVHSYHLACTDQSDVAATCNYGGNFVAAIERDNIFATQFHPEKSQRDGLALLRNFLAYTHES